MTDIIDLGYRPREPFIAFHKRKQRWACIVAHRRAGKTVACIIDLIDFALRHKGGDARFAYIAPTYSQAKDVAWTYCKGYVAQIPGVKISEKELTITLPNGARVRLYGSDNYDRLRGIFLDGAVLDEVADMDPRAWPEVIRPALADRKGWAVFIGTSKGRNAFYDLAETAKANPEEWFYALLRADQTGLLPEEELESLKRLMTPEQYAQEMLCSFDAAVQGAFYGRDIEQAEGENRITSVPHDRAADVYAAFDLGFGDSTAIWLFQIIGQEWHFIDYYEASGQALDHFVDWMKSRRFMIHEVLLPHDGEAHELQTGKSRQQFLEERGFRVRIVPRHNPMDGINAVRLRFNRFWFDKDKCDFGIKALRMYRTEYDARNKVFRDKALHDWTSHCADALRTGVMGVFETRQTALPQIDTSWVA